MKVDKLRVLIVEDSEADELLLIRELRRGGLHFESERVQTAEEMQRALASHPFDVILADFVLPNFGAEQALAVMKQRVVKYGARRFRRVATLRHPERLQNLIPIHFSHPVSPKVFRNCG